jgi:hypothetical protein
MITTLRGVEDVMEESMVLRKSDAIAPARSIDFAVISSVRRDLFPDKLKLRSKAWLLAIHLSLEFVPFSF